MCLRTNHNYTAHAVAQLCRLLGRMPGNTAAAAAAAAATAAATAKHLVSFSHLIPYSLGCGVSCDSSDILA